MQDDLDVTIVENTNVGCRHWHYLEVLDAPHKKARLHADDAIVPGRFGGRRGVLDAMVNVGADQFDIAILEAVRRSVHEPIMRHHCVSG